MDIQYILDAVFDFFSDMSRYTACYVGGTRIPYSGLMLAYLGVPVILMFVLPWFENDNDDD